MKVLCVIGLCASVGCATACFAADNLKSEDTALKPAQLGDYSLEFDSTVPRYGVPDPAGMTTQTHETIRPFVGFKLSTPLTDKFFGGDGRNAR